MSPCLIPWLCVRRVNPRGSPVGTILRIRMIWNNPTKPGDPGIMMRMEGEPGMGRDQLQRDTSWKSLSSPFQLGIYLGIGAFLYLLESVFQTFRYKSILRCTSQLLGFLRILLGIGYRRCRIPAFVEPPERGGGLIISGREPRSNLSLKLSRDIIRASWTVESFLIHPSSVHSLR